MLHINRRSYQNLRIINVSSAHQNIIGVFSYVKLKIGHWILSNKIACAPKVFQERRENDGDHCDANRKLRAINHSSFSWKKYKRKEKKRKALRAAKSKIKTYLAGVRLDWLFVRESAANRPKRQPAVFCSGITAKKKWITWNYSFDVNSNL